MRIAFVGKGGSGKTTAASLLIQALLARGRLVFGIDADINQHLGIGLGLTPDVVKKIPEVGNSIPVLKEMLRGSNPLIPVSTAMVKTTPPGPGSHLISMNSADPVIRTFAYCKDNLIFLRAGGFLEQDLGTKCFHAKTGAIELILNHLVDLSSEWTVVDMTAGADAFASGLFTRFDLTVLIVEPTQKSLSVWRQYKDYADNYGIAISVVGNKIHDEDDLAILTEACGEDMIGHFVESRWVRKAERGTLLPFRELEPENKATLDAIIAKASQFRRDWDRYWHWAKHFHVKNAESWANEAAGCDVTRQIDHEFLDSFAMCPPGTDAPEAIGETAMSGR